MRIASQERTTKWKILAHCGIRTRDLQLTTRTRYHWATGTDVCEVDNTSPGFNCAILRSLPAAHGRICRVFLSYNICIVLLFDQRRLLTVKRLQNVIHDKLFCYIYVRRVTDTFLKIGHSGKTRWTFIHSTDISLRSSVVARLFRSGRSRVRIPLWARFLLFVIHTRLAILTALVSPCEWNQPWHTPS